MKTYISLTIIKGGDISSKTVKKIDEIWQKAFPGNESVDPRNRKFFSNNIFFIVRNKIKILSCGRLVPVEVNFMGKRYKIMGIADIVSVIKEKGYGKILMSEIYKYIKKRKQTGIGFCSQKNSLFYQKCGFMIVEGQEKRFLFRNKEGKMILELDEDDECIVYLEGKDNFIKNVLANPKEKILVPRSHW